MTDILVVDDSTTDQILTGGLLKSRDDWNVSYAENGEDALESIAKTRPALVVTDMIMPIMGGLDLAREIKKRYPLIPVILMTSKGNERIAVEALQAGASSYLPKAKLSESLVGTAEQLLALSSAQRTEQKLTRCMVETESLYEIENDGDLIAPLVSALQEAAIAVGLLDEPESIRLGVALDEAINNAIFHGNLGLSSDKRDRDHDTYLELVAQRRVKPPYNTRRVTVEAKVNAQSGEFQISDGGDGFDPVSLPDPTDSANLERLGGRGIMLMKTFMDEVSFNEKGNVVTLKIHAPA